MNGENIMVNKFSKKEESEMLKVANEWLEEERERISPFLPKYLVDKLKADAKAKGVGYNILLKEILEREYSSEKQILDRVKDLEKEVESLKKAL